MGSRAVTFYDSEITPAGYSEKSIDGFTWFPASDEDEFFIDWDGDKFRIFARSIKSHEYTKTFLFNKLAMLKDFLNEL